MQKNKIISVQKLVILGILIAMDVVLTRFLSIQLPFSRIGFGFLPVAVAGMLFGPIYAMIASIFGDLLGMALFPTASYFIGFTISAGLRGFIYGLFLRIRPLKFTQILIAASLVSIIVTLALDTTWLHIMFGKSYIALLPLRLTQSATMLFVQAVLISFVYEGILKKSNIESQLNI